MASIELALQKKQKFSQQANNKITLIEIFLTYFIEFASFSSW